jgi:hypothetical protein
MSEDREESSAGARAPVEDGWEPEPDRAWVPSKLGSGPVEYFRAVPARGPAWLGTIAIVGGWAAAIYVAWFSDRSPVPDSTGYQLQLMLSIGLQATIAAGILFGVAAYLWVRVMPAAPDDGA